MQLNMGEGKSSVIVPLVASALADGSRVVRVVVAKPQSKQIMHTLIAKLGGLINQRVLYLPFSRSIRLSPGQIESVRAMIQACQQEGGMLLVQPEHLLSFKLMGIEKIWHEAQQNPTMGGDILQFHQEFEALSRDIVDESDENFSVKFELIYTMGSQQPVEMSPERWILIEAVMELLRDVVKRLARSESGGERQDKSGGFPTIRVLEDAAGQHLVETLAHQICALDSDSIRSVAFSPDSKMIASGSDDNSIKIWDASTGTCTQTLKGHSGSISSVAFSPDSKMIASGSYDDTVKIWDAATGSSTQTLRGA
ncbi:Protein of unknown function (DUF3638) domain containing protein [Rhypophila sp. PSN 637]